MRQGFNQIEMRPTDKEKTAFWASQRRWQWKVMPFGLKIARACFLKVIDDALACHSNAKCYIDDILIHSRSFKDHIAHIRHVFESGSAVGLKVHSSKCVFDAHKVPYLGHIFSVKGVSPMTA